MPYMAHLFQLQISICSILLFNHAFAQSHHDQTAGLNLPLFHFLHRYPDYSFSNSMDLLRGAAMSTKQRISRITGLRQGVERSGDRLKGYEGAIFTRIKIGTPPQEVSAIVDTGGSLVWVQCKQQYFQKSNSSTFHTVPCNSNTCRNEITANSGYLLNQASCNGANTAICNYGYNASGFNTIGTLSTDTLSVMDKETVPNLIFGCAELDQPSSENFTVPASLALGSSSLSLISQLPPSLGKRFAYCIKNANDLTVNPSNDKDFDGGFLSLGQSASLNDETGVQYTPLLTRKDSPYYYVNLEGISVAGRRLTISRTLFKTDPQNPATGAILDSGTALNVLPSAAFEALREAIRRTVPYPEVVPETETDAEMVCYDVGREAEEAFKSVLPPITFHLEGADWEFSANSSYVLANRSMACLVTMACNDCGSFSIIGTLQQQHFKVLLDLDAKKIGFVKATCK